VQGFYHLLEPDFLRIHSVDKNPLLQGTSMSVNMHKGQESLEPQFFIAIEDDSDMGNQAAPPGKERHLVVQILPFDKPAAASAGIELS
jgi:hypothetical protein